MGLLIKAFAPGTFWEATSLAPADFASLTWSNFLLANLLPVTIGNIIGGGFMVGLVYWFIYLRPSWTQKPVPSESKEPALAQRQ